MPKAVRCISRKVNGLTQVAIPQLFVDPFDDGEERTLPDDIADLLLKNPCFEQVQAPIAPVVTRAVDEVSK